MNVDLSEAEVLRVRSLMHSGKFEDEASVVAAALDLLERKQRLLDMIQEGIDSADRGEVVELDDAVQRIRKRLTELRTPLPVETAT